MAVNRFSVSIDKIIYDPVKGRIVYDLLASVLSTGLVFFVFWISGKNLTNSFLPLYYSFIYLFLNVIFGLYGRNKTSSLTKKIIIICSSNFIAFLFIAIFSSQYFLLTFFLIINSITTIFPRFFLNFNVERTSFKKINTPSKRKSPILVVGGGGYIGSILVTELLKKNYKVRVFDKFIYDRNIFDGVRNAKNLEIIEGDISDIFKLTLAVKDSRAIIHLAGIVGDPAAALDEKLTRHVNIASTRLLKETAKAFGVEKFIFASSCSVYGFSDKLLNEGSKCKPVSLYAKTKLDSERELLSDTADTFHPTILRFATVFGHSKKPRFDLVANLFVAQAFYNKKIRVEGGSQWRPFVHVKDIARAIILTLEAKPSKVSRKIYNVGDEKMNVQIETLANIVAQEVGEKKLKILVAKKSNDKRSYRVSFDRIKQDLKFSYSISLEEGIREIYLNFKNKKYKKSFKDPYYINSEMTKELKKEFYSKKYRKSHFSTIS